MYEQLVALDIVNPFNNSIKSEGLKELIRRVNETNSYDKVGKWFYRIEDVVNGKEPRGKDFTEYVVEWLNHLNGLRQTKKNLNFTLDLSLI